MMADPRPKQVFENFTDVSSYSYDSTTEELVSYDTPDIVTAKAQYVINRGLAGSMFWDVCHAQVPRYISALTRGRFRH